MDSPEGRYDTSHQTGLYERYGPDDLRIREAQCSEFRTLLRKVFASKATEGLQGDQPQHTINLEFLEQAKDGTSALRSGGAPLLFNNQHYVKKVTRSEVGRALHLYSAQNIKCWYAHLHDDVYVLVVQHLSLIPLKGENVHQDEDLLEKVQSCSDQIFVKTRGFGQSDMFHNMMMRTDGSVVILDAEQFCKMRSRPSVKELVDPKRTKSLDDWKKEELELGAPDFLELNEDFNLLSTKYKVLMSDETHESTTSSSRNNKRQRSRGSSSSHINKKYQEQKK